VERELAPKLIADIGKWELFPGTFVIGSKELDRYIRIPSQSVAAVWRALEYFDGRHTPSQIASHLLDDGWRIDVPSLCAKLGEAGLIVGSRYYSDLDRISVTWCEVRIGRFFPAWARWQLVERGVVIAMFLSLLAAALLLLRDPVHFSDVWQPGTGAIVISTTLGVLVSIFVHEGGHALAACSEGLRPSNLRLVGYLGVIPYIMLRIPGLYTVHAAARLRVWLAGPLASLGLASFCYLGSAVTILPFAARAWLNRVSVVNAMIALWNCCPLLPTDGYFVACTLIKQTNWRIRSWREVSASWRERRKPQSLLLLYGVLSLFALVLLALRNMTRFLRATHFSWYGYAAVLFLILLFALKRLALKRQRFGRDVTC